MIYDAEPSAAAGPSVSDQMDERQDEELTPAERDAIEMAMSRRAWFQQNHPDVPRMTQPADLLPGILAHIEVLPNGLARRWDSAQLSLRNARKDAKRNPESAVHQENVRAMERQLLRAWADVCGYKALQKILAA